MKKHTIVALLVVATLTLLASCGGTEGGSQNQEGGNQGNGREGTGTTSQQAQREEPQPDETTGGVAGMDHSNMDHGPSMGGEEMARRMLEGPNGEYSDERFIDMMVPHHQSAIDMANVVLEVSENPRLRELVENIIEAQEREIAQMERWREEWYPEG